MGKGQCMNTIRLLRSMATLHRPQLVNTPSRQCQCQRMNEKGNKEQSVDFIFFLFCSPSENFLTAEIHLYEPSTRGKG